MIDRLALSYLKLNFFALLVSCLLGVGCASTYQTYHGDPLPGRLRVVSIPGSCYYYVKDTATGLCWLSCFDQSMIADEGCQYFDKAFAGRKLEADSSTSLKEGKQRMPEPEPKGAQTFSNSPRRLESQDSVSKEGKLEEDVLPVKKEPDERIKQQLDPKP